MISDMGDDEPLEDGLPPDTDPVTDFTDAPTMQPVPIPDDFAPDDDVDLDDVAMEPDPS